MNRHFLIALFAAGSIYGQTSGEINGRVTDASKAVAPGATVTAVNTERRTQRATKSNEQGYYSLPSLDPGAYAITVELAGFKPMTHTGIKLDVNQSIRLDFTVEVGQVTEKVQVTGEAPLLEANTAGLGTVVTEEKISDLPLNARNFTQLLTLTPGASPISVAQNKNGGQTTPRIGVLTFPAINGQTNRSNSFTLDGVYNNGHFTGTYTVAPNIDALNQFKVQSHSDQAEFGGVSGGVINIASKSGTNELHGSLYEFIRNDALDARGFFTANKPPLRQNQFGGAVGGPIIRNKTFFHFSYEGYRQVNASSQLALVPTAAERAGDFSASARRVLDPYSTRPNTAVANQFLRDPFPNGQIPASRLSPSIRAFNDAVVPLPTSTGVPNFNARNDDPQKAPSDTYSIRVDQYLGSRDSLWSRYTWSEQDSSSALALKGSRITMVIPAKNLGVGYVHTFGPNTVLTALFGISSTTFSDAPVFTSKNLIGDGFFKGFANDPRTTTPGVAVPGYFSLSMRNRVLGPQRGFQEHADLSHNAGRHNLKFGGEVVRQPWTNTQITETLTFNTRQSADLNSLGNTGNALASYMMGLMDTTELSQADFTLESQIINFYAQDSWKVTDRLTLNFGLRWDISRAPDFSHDFASTWDFNSGKFLVGIAKPPACGQTAKAPCLSDPNNDFIQRYVVFTGSSKLMKDQWALLGPRFGFAWQAQRRTVVRGSFGLFYDLVAGTTQRSQNMSINNANWPGSAGRSVVSNATLVTATADAPFGDVNPLVPTATPANQAPYSDPNIRNVYSEQWNLEIQHELLANLAMSAAYVGSHNLRIAIGGDYNTAVVPGPGPIGPRQLWPYAPVTAWDRAAGQSHYHGLQVKLERRMARGLAFLTAYTWSKSIDTASSGYGSGENISLQTPFDPNASKSISGFDIPHLFSTAVVYELPFGRGKAWLHDGIAARVFGNWKLNGIITLRSGDPFTPQMNLDIANIGAVNNATRARPDVLRDPTLSNPTPQAWFDKTAFATPRQFTFGSAGRNILRSDSVQNFDASLFREDRITERLKLQFRAELFNAFNHPSFGVPQNVYTNPQFGQVSGTNSTARQIQLGLKILF
jgi:hypothetical protein